MNPGESSGDGSATRRGRLARAAAQVAAPGAVVRSAEDGRVTTLVLCCKRAGRPSEDDRGPCLSQSGETGWETATPWHPEDGPPSAHDLWPVDGRLRSERASTPLPRSTESSLPRLGSPKSRGARPSIRCGASWACKAMRGRAVGKLRPARLWHGAGRFEVRPCACAVDAQGGRRGGGLGGAGVKGSGGSLRMSGVMWCRLWAGSGSPCPAQAWREQMRFAPTKQRKKAVAARAPRW